MTRSFICFVFLMLCLVGTSIAATVVFVSSEDESSQAVGEILKGIERPTIETTIVVTDHIDNTSLHFENNNPKIIIGSKLVEQTRFFSNPLWTVGGGFYEPISNDIPIPTISLYPSIETIVNEIAKTGFNLNRLITVTPNKNLSVDLERYSAQLSDSGIEQIIINSAGERGTARAWFEVLRDIDPQTDAVYISGAQFLESSGTYKAIIEAAWKRDILVVSALPQYARRGVSIGFIPDLGAYGELLVDTAYNLDRAVDGPAQRSNRVDTDILLRVFNQRTLEHIGYSLPDDIDSLKRDDLVIE